MRVARRALAPASPSEEPPQEEWEYCVTTGRRKAWDGEPDLTKEGWELDVSQGRDGWERFDYHEEMYWRRRKPPAAPLQPETQEEPCCSYVGTNRCPHEEEE